MNRLLCWMNRHAWIPTLRCEQRTFNDGLILRIEEWDDQYCARCAAHKWVQL